MNGKFAKSKSQRSIEEYTTNESSMFFLVHEAVNQK